MNERENVRPRESDKRMLSSFSGLDPSCPPPPAMISAPASPYCLSYYGEEKTLGRGGSMFSTEANRPYPYSDLGEESPRHDVSPDSGTEDPNQLEERVQVDRRKLELMISNVSQYSMDYLPTAESFFSEIMAQTGAQISWPSRLKIGAKTKKGFYSWSTKDLERTLQNQYLTLRSKKGGKTEPPVKLPVPAPPPAMSLPQWALQQEFQQHAMRYPTREMIPVMQPIRIPVPYPMFHQQRPALAHGNQQYEFGREYQTQFNRYGGTKGFVQRKTLIDTFIDRDDDYWMSRVTLKMDVPYTDHSHIIGRQGKNTQLVMKETGCHIHFPDSNKNQECDKSNQVSIAGPPLNVERARSRIRDLAPLTITFELKSLKPGVNPQNLADHPSLETLTRTEDLHVIVRHNKSSGTPYALVRGSAYQEHKIREAVHKLQELVFLKGTPVLCSLSMEILQPQQDGVKGPNNNNIRVITQRTGAQIHYPSCERSGATTFYVQGSLEAILTARRFLLGCLPVFLMFELRGDSEVPYDVETLGNEHNVSVSVKPKRGCESKSVVIRSLESNLTNVYAVRSKLLGPVNDLGHTVVCQDYTFMTDLCCPQAARTAAIFSSLQNLQINTNSVPYAAQAPMMISPLSPAPGQFFNPGFLFGSYGGGQMENVLVRDSSRPSESSSEQKYEAPRDDDEDDDTQIIVGNQQMPSSSSSSALYVAPTTKNQAPNVPSHQGKESVPGTPNDPLPGQSPLATALVSAAKFSRKNSVSDWKAPGAERSTPKTDYEERRLAAARVMQQRPSGVRMPNGRWAKLGFSKTMPDGVLREVMPRREHEIELPSADNSLCDTPLSKEKPLTQIVEEEMMLTGTMGPWPVGENSSPVYNRKAFLSTMHFEPNILGLEQGAEFEECLRNGDLPGILTYLGYGQYIDLFQAQEIDFETFLTLSEEDLKTIGLNTVGARKKVKTLIDSLKAMALAESSKS